MIGRLVVAIFVLLSSALTQAHAQAARAEECRIVEKNVWVGGQLVLKRFRICRAEEDVEKGSDGDFPSVSGTIGPVGPEPPRDSGWDAACVRTALSEGVEDIAGFCDVPPPPAEPAEPAPAVRPVVVLTPGMVSEAFRRVPLPASVLQVQPPEGETLVSFDTNFYTEAAGFDRSLTLLGQRIDLHLYPIGYTWVYGDGVSVAGVDPGAPYPDLRVTHAYLRRGLVRPRVDTAWAARYRSGRGGWRPVAGTVTVTGDPVPLRVLEARPNLTAGN